MRLGRRRRLARTRLGTQPSLHRPTFQLQFARIVTHYFTHGARLEEDQLLRNDDRLAGIPGVLLHGQLDLGGPVDVPRCWHRPDQM